jgi:hypothetical protein
VHNETLSVVAMRVGNEDCSPIGINRCDAAPTPTGFAEIVSDDLPVFHAMDCAFFHLHTAASVVLNEIFGSNDSTGECSQLLPLEFNLGDLHFVTQKMHAYRPRLRSHMDFSELSIRMDFN